MDIYGSQELRRTFPKQIMQTFQSSNIVVDTDYYVLPTDHKCLTIVDVRLYIYKPFEQLFETFYICRPNFSERETSNYEIEIQNPNCGTNQLDTIQNLVLIMGLRAASIHPLHLRMNKSRMRWCGVKIYPASRINDKHQRMVLCLEPRRR